jgi:poly-gamma-glutamate synthesis protein (capsule biosynthesis protein)
MKSLIRELKKSVDFVIVSWHNGIEYSHAPMLPARRRCRELIDAGADIILGHHPHVAQGMEYYKHGVILYSLGNFMFDRRFVQPHSSGLLVRAVISKDGISCEPFFLTGDFQTGMPVIANRETTMEKLKCLNANIGSRKLWKADCRTFWAQYLKEVHRDWKNPYRLFHNTCAYARARHHWRILLGTLGI